MKKRNLKKWMIGLLSLALMFSNLPQVVHAQDTVHEAGDEASLRSALSEAEAGETITLTAGSSSVRTQARRKAIHRKERTAISFCTIIR